MSQTNTTRAWLIVAVATFGLIVSNGLSIGGIPVFYKGIQDDLIARGAVDATHAQTFISNCANITFFMSGVFSMLGGWLLTRISLKFLMILGAVALGVGLVMHAGATTVETVYLSRFLMGASLGFVGVTPSVVLVSNWFDKDRGMALGILLTGTSLGGVSIPFIATPLINAYGWRTAMLLVSLLVWLLLLPAIVFFVKDRQTTAEDAVVEVGITLREAIRTPIFWVLASARHSFSIRSLSPASSLSSTCNRQRSVFR